MIGSRLGHYRIVGAIGAGGMGEVWEARDERLGRTVALKLLPAARTADDAARARLLEEARTASALNHPNICTIHEVGEAGGLAYIAMERVSGRPLTALVATGALAAEDVVRIGREIADALAHAHEHGVIHRDLKCANVMITAEGRAKVLDFGIAKRIDGAGRGPGSPDPNRTPTGVLVGTPFATAPEALRGEPADARSDLWSLGVLLYELASGEPPFRAKTEIELAAAVLHEAPAPLPARVPAALAALILRLLAKDPTQRYQSGGEVRAALETLAHGAPAGGSQPRHPPGVPARVWLGLALLVAASGALWMLNPFDWRGAVRHGVGGGRIRALAVLPLDDFSKDPEQEYFADGMTEAIITQLAQIQALKVSSRTSAMAYKGARKPLRRIAEELGVDAVVEGSVARAGDRVRVTAQLIEAATDKHLWAASYDRETKDVLVLQDEVARDIAREIRVQLTPAERARFAAHRAVNPEAYDLYLKGRYHLHRVTREDMMLAIELFRRAAALDPGDARPLSGIADAYTLLAGVLTAMPGAEAWPRVREHAERALALDPELAEAHASMGAGLWLGDWDWAGAEREFRRSIELNPGYAPAREALGLMLVSGGRTEEGLVETRRSCTLDPLSLLTGTNAMYAYYYARRWDDLLAQGERVMRIEPGFPRAAGILRHMHEWRGDLRAALSYYERSQGPDTLGRLPVSRVRAAFERSGARGYWEAERESARLRGLERTYPMWAAVPEAQLGRRDEAFRLLDLGLAGHESNMAFVRVEPLLDPLRDDPRFGALLARMGLARQGGGAK
jgi:TolB-like protein